MSPRKAAYGRFWPTGYSVAARVNCGVLLTLLAGSVHHDGEIIGTPEHPVLFGAVLLLPGTPREPQRVKRADRHCRRTGSAVNRAGLTVSAFTSMNSRARVKPPRRTWRAVYTATGLRLTWYGTLGLANEAAAHNDGLTG
jgi:hypothetical protein